MDYLRLPHGFIIRSGMGRGRKKEGKEDKEGGKVVTREQGITAAQAEVEAKAELEAEEEKEVAVKAEAIDDAAGETKKKRQTEIKYKKG